MQTKTNTFKLKLKQGFWNLSAKVSTVFYALGLFSTSLTNLYLMGPQTYLEPSQKSTVGLFGENS